ncbi:hypothetical protein GIB67_021565, partial [Kingdonia uniflora]
FLRSSLSISPESSLSLFSLLKISLICNTNIAWEIILYYYKGDSKLQTSRRSSMRRDLFIWWSCEAKDEVSEVSPHTHEYVTFSWFNSLQITCKDPMANHLMIPHKTKRGAKVLGD